MDWVQFIDAAGWPIAALAFGIVFILKFSNQIGALMLRVRSVGKAGVNLGVSDVQSEERRKEAVAELMKGDDSPLLLEIEVPYYDPGRRVSCLVIEGRQTRK